VAGFTDDCVVRFGTVPELRGRRALREFFTERSARQENYRLDKQFRALMGDVIANVWSGRMGGRRHGRAHARLWRRDLA
jgi:nuclear transport factor 2 (NTF2) superfamily protein